MSQSGLKRRLLKLAETSQRSNFQRIVDVLPEIDTAMDAGATRAQIIEALNAEGIDVTPKVFTNYMLRIREMRARAGLAPTPPGGLPPSDDEDEGEDSQVGRDVAADLGSEDAAGAPARRHPSRSGSSK